MRQWTGWVGRGPEGLLHCRLATEAWGEPGGPLARRPGALPSGGLTLQAQPAGAVLGVEQSPAAVSASVLGRGRHALPAPPVGTLGATGRPLAPLCPCSVHCRGTARGTWEHTHVWTHAHTITSTERKRTAQAAEKSMPHPHSPRPMHSQSGAPGGQREDARCHSHRCSPKRKHPHNATNPGWKHHTAHTPM